MIETTKSKSSSVEQAIAHFLATGESDPEYASNANRLDRRVDQPELQEILADAIAARNGWKRILAGCGASRVTLFPHAAPPAKRP